MCIRDRTHALLPGSPAINAGNSSLLPADTNDLDGDGNTTEPIPFDQRGTGFDRVFGGQIDIGAVEQQAVGLPCDFVGASGCDIADIDALITAISTGTGDAAFDLTGDGNVDLADRDQWLLDAGILNIGGAYLLADANLDGVVDASDFNIWNANKFASTGRWSRGDFNADGVTDASDFNVWNSNRFQASDRDSMLTLDLSDDDQAGKDEEAISVVDRVFSDFASKF